LIEDFFERKYDTIQRRWFSIKKIIEGILPFIYKKKIFGHQTTVPASYKQKSTEIIGAFNCILK